MVRLRAAIKLGGIVAALAAVPAVLYATAGNPLPAWPIDWGLVAESLSTGAVATSTWLQAVAVGGWLVWGYVIVALTLDVVATIRNRPSPVRAAPVRWVASTIVALATQLATVTMTLSPPPAAVDVQVAAASYDPTDTTESRPAVAYAPDGTRLVVVAEGDSWAGFAHTALGDPAAGPTIRTLNNGRDVGGRVLDGSEAFVEAGWQLVVPAPAPAATPVPAARPDDGDAIQPAVADAEELADDQEWTVQTGEHFWSIAASTLEEANGTPPSEGEVAAYWRELIDANADRLLPPHDPDLIYPDQRLVLPPVDDADATTELVEPEAEEPGEDLDAAEGPNEHSTRELPDRTGPQPGPPSDNGSGPTGTDDADDGAHGGDTGASAATGDRPDTDDDSPDRDADSDADSDADGGDVEVERTGWGTPAGLASGTAATMLLGGGVLALLRRRRRIALQQRPVKVRLPPLTDEQAAQMARLDAAAAPGEVLDELADLLCSIPEQAAPVLVTAGDDGSVALTFEPGALPPAPPAPWVHEPGEGDGPPRWVAMLGARGPRRSIGLPLLATLGRDGTTTVLGNIAAMRLLAVSGDHVSAVGRQLHAFALEVATSRTAGPVEVTVAGDAAVTSIEQLRPTDDPDAEVAAAADEVAEGIVADDRLPRLVVCHDPATVPHLPDQVDLVGVITTAEAGAARWRLHLDGQRQVVLHPPDGRDLVLDGVAFDPELVTDELAALDITELLASEVDPTTEVAAPDDHDADVRRWCEVGLLGPVTVTLGDQPLDTLTSMLREVLAYLATHPAATTDQLEDAVWTGQAAGSGQRVRAALTRLRSAVGATPDGEPLVPRRGPGDHTLALSPAVGTDLDRALGHLEVARRLDGDARLARLLAALDLVRGAPLQDLAVSWAADIEHRAVARLQDAAIEAAAALLEAGRLDAAEHAVQQGLKLCDPCEPLYVVWAQIEHARDRPDRIPQLWTRLRRRYADDADDTFATPATPMADTERAFAALAGRHPTAG